MYTPTRRLIAEEAVALLQTGQPLTDCYISGELALAPGETWEQQVVLENCVVERFYCPCTSFSKGVELRNCRFQQCQFTFSYFLGGLIVDACYFDSYLDFQAGGHNQLGNPVRITNSRFASFVNFFDCWYESAVVITDNDFLGGTNLLGAPFNIPVTFNMPPVLARNSGQLDAADEGPTSSFNG
ncbi:hypothetical protein HHL22_04985 [Hymenobacter sp. RP-2-7]|uniref:Pentapeptide repeat-containing protein n=1 Tax=Hymenobacter polaris TaxID=2682546 RepID=A0A7Y0ABX3_9BACT|nr:hypothetical protein [Hymenobacter polaris]NML64554.1 hypothetical protein [Hymenobacter polaris]